jgi:hypothetical protein
MISSLVTLQPSKYTLSLTRISGTISLRHELFLVFFGSLTVAFVKHSSVMLLICLHTHRERERERQSKEKDTLKKKERKGI